MEAVLVNGDGPLQSKTVTNRWAGVGVCRLQKSETETKETVGMFSSKRTPRMILCRL